MYNTQTSTSQPLISFIITAYNLPEGLLKECLQSIFNLTLSEEEREVVVIDDGSDVSPLDEMDEFLDHLIYLRQPHRGPSAARNSGLQVAQGKYIQFIDGDDYLLQAPYEHCLDIIRYHDPDILLFEYTQKTKVDTPFNFEGPMNGTTYMHSHNTKASVCCYISKRTTVGSLRFNNDTTVEDELFTPQLLLRSERLYYTPAEAYYYRKRKHSLTQGLDKDTQHQRLDDTLRVIFKLQDLTETLPEMERMALNRRVAQLSMDYLYNTIRTTHSEKQLKANMERLRERGLYPLPDNHYTRKYTLFRRLVSMAVGRKILLMTVH